MVDGKIGCEVECFAKYSDGNLVTTKARELGWQVSSDGSIHPARNCRAYEFKSKVYSLNNVHQLFEDAEKIFAGVKVNKSCGLHIHLSFKNPIDYFKLYNYTFADRFQNKIKVAFQKTQLEKSRLNNSYCKFYSNEDDFKVATENQLTAISYKSDSRYYCINYNAFNLYKTVEFRVFAATNKIKKFRNYVKLLLKTVDEHLEVTKVPEVCEHVIDTDRVRDTTQPIIIREVI